MHHQTGVALRAQPSVNLARSLLEAEALVHFTLARALASFGATFSPSRTAWMAKAAAFL
jgi:hypothetical protein